MEHLLVSIGVRVMLWGGAARARVSLVLCAVAVTEYKIQVYNFFSPGYQMAHQRMRASKLYYIAGIYTYNMINQ